MLNNIVSGAEGTGADGGGEEEDEAEGAGLQTAALRDEIRVLEAHILGMTVSE